MTSSQHFLLSATFCILSVCTRVGWNHGAYIGKNPYAKIYSGPNKEERELRDAAKCYKMPSYVVDLEDKRSFDEEPTEQMTTLGAFLGVIPEDNNRIILSRR